MLSAIFPFLSWPIRLCLLLVASATPCRHQQSDTNQPMQPPATTKYDAATTIVPSSYTHLETVCPLSKQLKVAMIFFLWFVSIKMAYSVIFFYFKYACDLFFPTQIKSKVLSRINKDGLCDFIFPNHPNKMSNLTLRITKDARNYLEPKQSRTNLAFPVIIGDNCIDMGSIQLKVYQWQSDWSSREESDGVGSVDGSGGREERGLHRRI